MPYLAFVGKARAYPSGDHLDLKHQTRQKRKHSSLFDHNVSDERKKFYDIGGSCFGLLSCWPLCRQLGFFANSCRFANMCVRALALDMHTRLICNSQLHSSQSLKFIVDSSIQFYS